MKRTIVVFALFLPFLAACNDSGSGASAPTIDGVYTQTIDTEVERFSNTSLLSRYFVLASDEGGRENITLIEIKQPENDTWWRTIHDTRDTTDNYINNLNEAGFFDSGTYSTDEKVALHGYRVRVTNRAGASVTQSFDLTVPDGWQQDDKNFVYGYQFEGDRTNGLEALRLAEIDDLVVSENTLKFRLWVPDDRTGEGVIQFYKVTTDPDHIEPVGITRRLAAANGDFIAGSGFNNVDINLDDENDFKWRDPLDKSLDSATHYAVSFYGAPEVVYIDGHELELQPFWAWNGWHELFLQ